jgi:ribosomal protein L37E
VYRRVAQSLVWLTVPLAIAASVLWVRSYAVADIVGQFFPFESADGKDLTVWSFGVVTGRGGIRAQLRRVSYVGREEVRLVSADVRARQGRGWYEPSRKPYYPYSNRGTPRRVEVDFIRGPMGPSGSSAGWVFTIVLPLWLVAVAAITPLVIQHARAHMRKRQLKSALKCRRCGYDLRATPDRCPECGLPVTTTSLEGNADVGTSR